MKGYLNDKYASSFKEFGIPVRLSNSGGFVIKRSISGTEYFDAMGCYPFLVCNDWESLSTDLNVLKDSLVALSLVSDPFGKYNYELLKESFPEVCIPYKEHYIVNLTSSWESFIDKHHLRNIRKAKRNLRVEQIKNPLLELDKWNGLYANLIRRHNISGITKFSYESFKLQLDTPGLIAFKAMYKDVVIGMALFYKMDSVAYYHLAAYSEQGYQQRASYIIFWEALKYFRNNGVTHVSLGAGAGIANNGQDGLSRFKRGWSNETRPVYFCGKIFDRKIYTRLSRIFEKQVNFFPTYRIGEFS